MAAVPWVITDSCWPFGRISHRAARNAGYHLRATAQFGWSRNVLFNLLSDKERGPGDQPSIGIILCAQEDDVEVEYALRTKKNPIGVASYKIERKRPAEFKGKLPTARQLSQAVRSALSDETRL